MHSSTYITIDVKQLVLYVLVVEIMMYLNILRLSRLKPVFYILITFLQLAAYETT